MLAKAMKDLVLLFAVVIVGNVDGRRPPLPPLPKRDGCLVVAPEVEVFRVEGEAVILHFPEFKRVLQVRNLFSPSAHFLITKNGSAGEDIFLDEERVQQRDKQMWFLPAEASDSGEYTCTYRNNSFCITGSITLHVFQSLSADMDTLSYPVPVTVGEALNFRCPSVGHFNATEEQISWNKDSDPAHEGDSESSFHQEGGRLLIPTVSRSHAGLYICQLTVHINNQLFKVSRAILLQVQGFDFSTSSAAVDDGVSVTPTQSQPPVILSPSNGTTYERAHGSGLELKCLVQTECSMTESTEVTWLVNSQAVEAFYQDGHTFHGGRRVVVVPGSCQIELLLVIGRITEENERTEIKCVAHNRGGVQEVAALLQLEDSTVTWLWVAAVAASCFLTVVLIFLCVLFKPKRNKKRDYTLAHQSSIISI